MTGAEPVFKQLDNINLAAGSSQRIEIQVVDMDIALGMSLGKDRIQHIHFTELLGAFRTVFQHGSHRGIAVDVGVFPLDIVICRRLKGQILVNAHQFGIHVAHAGAFRTVEDEFLGGTGMSVFNEDFFHRILHLLHRRAGFVQLISQVGDDFLSQLFGHFPVVAA